MARRMSSCDDAFLDLSVHLFFMPFPHCSTASLFLVLFSRSVFFLGILPCGTIWERCGGAKLGFFASTSKSKRREQIRRFPPAQECTNKTGCNTPKNKTRSSWLRALNVHSTSCTPFLLYTRSLYTCALRLNACSSWSVLHISSYRAFHVFLYLSYPPSPTLDLCGFRRFQMAKNKE